MTCNEPNIIESAEILSIGTELLIGQTLDTNAFYLARKMAELGIDCYHRQVVGDHMDRIEQALRRALERSDLVITTGGLGPTDDDITNQAVANVTDLPLVEDACVNQSICDQYPRARKDGYVMPRIPKGSAVYPSHNGTAPASLTTVRFNGKMRHILMLPGPPSENVPLFEEQVQPALAQYTKSKLINHFIRLVGIGEYRATQILSDLIETQTNPTIAPYAGEGEVVFRITQKLRKQETDRTEELIHEIQRRLRPYIFEIGPRSLQEVVVDLLEEKGLTCAFAESCTAGGVAARLTSVAGASRVFKGGIVAYSNDVKSALLDVSEAILKHDGAVSERCAAAMAIGCRRRTAADIAVSVTGIAGPSGGTDKKPVGTVYFGVSTPNETKVFHNQFSGNRERNRAMAVVRALDLVRREAQA